MSENSQRTRPAVEQASERARTPLQQILLVPNQLTLIRMLLVPFILIAMLNKQHDMALYLFLAAALTDAADGLVARRFNQKTPLGACLDPIADKILLGSVFIVQSLAGAIPWWLTILVISRDALILAGTLVTVAVTQIRSFPPTTLGKANTVVKTLTILVVLMLHDSALPSASVVITSLFWATSTTTVLSSMEYMTSSARERLV